MLAIILPMWPAEYAGHPLEGAVDDVRLHEVSLPMSQSRTKLTNAEWVMRAWSLPTAR